MRHALRLFTTLGLVLTGAMVACSLKGGDDDDDSGATTGGTTSTGGIGIGITGGSTSNGGSNGGKGNTGGAPTGPAECPDTGLPKECGSSAETADIKTVNMMLVVDKSGSMVDTPDGFAENKWVSLGGALQTALSEVADQMNFGLILYPYDPNAGTTQKDVTCSVVDGPQAVNVPIGEGIKTVPQIVRIVQDTSPSGGTPTAAALRAALNYYTTGGGASVAGDKYVLLATDGGPNCNPLNTACSTDPNLCTVNLDSKNPGSSVKCNMTNCCIRNSGVYAEQCLDHLEVIDAIRQLKNAGVTTYVVGIPGTEAYASYLDQFAEASGQLNPNAPPKYYSVEASGGVEGLADVFKGIVTQLVHSCDIPLKEPPTDVNKVNVAIDCQLEAPTNPTGGWEIDTTSDPNKLILKGETCANVQINGAKRVDLYYGCPPIL
ncbi:MAG TPA: hypothetical protein VG937_18290 [Polyangiaceae bacterium]|nr:hypothetical protein [Polyangiaceae bacterium]